MATTTPSDVAGFAPMSREQAAVILRGEDASTGGRESCFVTGDELAAHAGVINARSSKTSFLYNVWDSAFGASPRQMCNRVGGQWVQLKDTPQGMILLKKLGALQNVVEKRETTLNNMIGDLDNLQCAPELQALKKKAQKELGVTADLNSLLVGFFKAATSTTTTGTEESKTEPPRPPRPSRPPRLSVVVPSRDGDQPRGRGAGRMVEHARERTLRRAGSRRWGAGAGRGWRPVGRSGLGGGGDEVPPTGIVAQ